MKKLYLVAVDIRSAHNVGAFLRTCDGFDAGLVLVGITPRPQGNKNDNRLPHVQAKANKEIAKTALGAEKTVAWKYFENFEVTIQYLRAEGFKIFAVEQSPDSSSLASLNGSDYENIALVVGTEVTGLTQEQLLLCDGVFEIPMNGKKESFNVSVAAGIALYQAKL